MNGIYSIAFRGQADWGLGLLVLQNGIITGADVGGVTYDGTYKDLGSALTVDLKITVPPGARLVQGTPPRPVPYDVKFKETLPKDVLSSGASVTLNMPPGPVNVIFRKLRDLPA